MSKKLSLCRAICASSLLGAGFSLAAPVLPGYLTDPTAVRGATLNDAAYLAPETR